MAGNELTILWERVGGVPALRVDVEWEDRPVQMTAAAAARVEERWANYVADAGKHGRSLFNGAITRLLGVEEEAGRVKLRLGPGEYKAFVVTRLRDRAWFEAYAPGIAVKALGNSVLLTHGETALLGIRSAAVSAYAGRAHLIGGVLDLLGAGDLPAGVEGIVRHLRKELEEEAKVDDAMLAAGPEWPTLLGVAHDEFLGQPEAIWGWEMRVPLEGICAGLDAREHSGGILVRRGRVGEDYWRQATPVARYALDRWVPGMLKK